MAECHEEGRYYCKFCSCSFVSRARLNSHLKRHASGRTFKCPECRYSLVTKSHMYDHMKNVHSWSMKEAIACFQDRPKGPGGRPKNKSPRRSPKSRYNCGICGIGYSTKWGMTRHKNAHKKGGNFACPYCGFPTVLKGVLYDHLISDHDFEKGAATAMVQAMTPAVGKPLGRPPKRSRQVESLRKDGGSRSGVPVQEVDVPTLPSHHQASHKVAHRKFRYVKDKKRPTKRHLTVAKKIVKKYRPVWSMNRSFQLDPEPCVEDGDPGGQGEQMRGSCEGDPYDVEREVSSHGNYTSAETVPVTVKDEHEGDCYINLIGTADYIEIEEPCMPVLTPERPAPDIPEPEIQAPCTITSVRSLAETPPESVCSNCPGSCKYRYECHFCGIGFMDGALYAQHYGCHSHENPWTCTVCGNTYQGSLSFNAHMIHSHAP